MRRSSGAYTSPGTPEYGDMGEIPITWSSERVPFANNNRKRYINAAALIPLNGGRTLPSKWDDAERWITSPVSGFKNSFPQPQRRQKSKSGPLDPGLGYLSNYSPIGNVLEGSNNARNFTANSPLTTGVLVPNGLSIHYNGGIVAKSNSLYGDNNITRSTSVPGLSDLMSETSPQSSQDDRLDGVVEEEYQIPQAVSRRDMATQMSPDESNHSSNKDGLSFSNLPHSRPTSVRLQNDPAGKDEVRDVQVDKGTTTKTKPSRKHGVRKMKDLRNVEDLPSAWNVNEASKNTSKSQREEAKITAWENLQKAKAEAEIRKLEMKLEKKRSASMDKIMNRLRAAQMKAEAIRNSLSENHGHPSSKNSKRWIFSMGECFLCCRH